MDSTADTITNYEFRISPGLEGVYETLAIMRKLARQGKADPRVILFARGLIQGIPPKNKLREALEFFLFVRDKIRYVMDPEGVELLTSPARLLEIGAGDCDDKVTLLAALLGSIGIKTRFVAISLTNGGDLSHVYLEAYIGDEWIPMETTERVQMGELPFSLSDVKNRRVFYN